jgi:Na+-translocating ferredoxin:NAD+ oxidoreductase subunit D
MTQDNNKTEYILSQAPHIRTDQSLSKIMWLVNLALLPAAINSIYIFGIKSLLLIITSIAAAVAAESATRYLLKRPLTITNGSAVLTGLLLAMNVSPELPLWMVALGSFFAIIIVKELFGGIGFNIFNPALAGRAFLMASWPKEMTGKWFEFGSNNILSPTFVKAIGKKIADTTTSASVFGVDSITSATPLGAIKNLPNNLEMHAEKLDQLLFSQSMFTDLFTGNVGGCLGETSALFLLIGALFLMYKKIVTWEIPTAFIGTFSLIIFAYYYFTGFPFPYKVLLYHILSGGLILGAFFMATDMVTSPLTQKGMIYFGIGCGFIAAIIRLWGGYPEGVSYSILLMNAVVPLIDRWIKPKIFGTIKNNLN